MDILKLHTLSTWKFAVIGAIASLPVTAILNWLPNSEADITGGIMVVGAFIAGAIAAIRSSDPSAAGLRAGIIAVVVESLRFIVIDVPTVMWTLPMVIFWGLGIGVVGFMVCLFGTVFGHIGGWMTNTVSNRWMTNTDIS